MYNTLGYAYSVVTLLCHVIDRIQSIDIFFFSSPGSQEYAKSWLYGHMIINYSDGSRLIQTHPLVLDSVQGIETPCPQYTGYRGILLRYLLTSLIIAMVYWLAASRVGKQEYQGLYE